MTEDTASGKYTDPLSLNKYTYCHNQPVTGYDPDGHALQILLGAAIGGVIGAASSLYEQRKVIGTGAYSYKKYWGSVAEGAITGAVAAATGGASLATTGAKAVAKTAVKKFAVNTASGFAGNTVNQLISKGKDNYSFKEAFTSGLTENIDIPGLQAAEKTAKKVGNKILNKVTEFISSKAGHEVAEEAGSKALTKTLTNSSDAGVNGTGPNPYALMKEKGIPQTLSDAEIDAAKQVDLQMNAKRGGKVTTVELNSFGNKSKPRGARPKDFDVDSVDDVVGPEKAPLPKGASNAANVDMAPLRGQYHKLPAGTELPDGLDVIADGSDVIPDSPRFPGHHTIFPTREMTVNEFNKLYLSLPWKHGGNKK